ncbi:MAG TPA: rRNA maturation RNase YbeY [Bacteroidales bacterium]|nr:rRNA maturation RNase YbeY [Bacteroidales bacterium]HRS19883.1 rRNA maturation RNase YbeY [Bacteroidales bacterium]
MHIGFYEEDAKIVASFKKKQFRALVQHIVSKESSKTIDYINFIACTDSYLLAINKEYLKHDYFTDIITFDYSETEIASDIYVSIDRISENATSNSVSLLNELQRVLIHGVLHLVGYQDDTESNKQVMTQKENYYLHLLA